MRGILRRRDIGLNDRQLAAMVGLGRLVRVARGWYATGEADDQVLRALRLGGRLSCLSAARIHGLWVPEETRDLLHVAVRHGDPVLLVPGVKVHRLDTAGWRTTEPVIGLKQTLVQVLQHHSVEASLMVLESAVRRGLLTSTDARALIRLVPERRRRAGLQHFDPRSEAGSETRVRLWYQRRNRRVRAQVSISGVGRVDLLVGDSLVIEVDSRAHHTGEERYQSDRRRDLRLVALGFTVLRLSWEQVFLDWPMTVRLLEQTLRLNRHALALHTDAQIHLPELRTA